MQDSDWRYFWAAYQFGMWEDEIPRDLTREQFQNAVIDALGDADVEFVFEVHVEGTLRPIGLTTGEFRLKGNGLEVHAWWFPYAKPRQILESAVHFLRDVGKQFKILAIVDQENLAFYERVNRYKVLKKGCKITDAYAPGEDAMLFYTPGPFK